MPLDSTVVGAHWPQFLKMLEAAVGAPKRNFGPVDAQTAAARLYAQVQVFANDASFEVPMGYAEDKITKVLGSRVLYPSDLRLATVAVGSLLSLLQENPPLTGAMRRKNRVARKQIYLSLAFFFSEGAVCVTRGVFFFMRGGLIFFFFFTVARRNFTPQQKVVPTQKSSLVWHTVQTEVPLETADLTKEQMRYVFFCFFLLFFFLCGGFFVFFYIISNALFFCYLAA